MINPLKNQSERLPDEIVKSQNGFSL